MAFQELIHLFNTVFEEAGSPISSEARLGNLLRTEHFVALAAFSEGKVVGGLTAYELPMYSSERSEIFLYDVAVQAEFQRTGIGKRLLLALKAYFARHGIEEFSVFAHAQDEHAIEFYHSTGGKSEQVINFLYDGVVDKE